MKSPLATVKKLRRLLILCYKITITHNRLCNANNSYIALKKVELTKLFACISGRSRLVNCCFLSRSST